MEPRDDERIRLFLAARGAADAHAARLHWDALLEANFDRVKAFVRLEGRVRGLDDEERDDALFRAIVRISNRMIETFAGTTMGEWVNATRTLVRYACADAQRSARAVSARERAFAPGDDVAAPEEPGDEDRAGFLDWALPQLQGHRRGVLELDRRGHPVEEIMRRLGVSRDVVYQSRRRGLQDLDALREQWP